MKIELKKFSIHFVFGSQLEKNQKQNVPSPGI